MIITPPSPAASPRSRRRAAGFTLAEVLIGATLASFVLAGVISTFVFLGRSGLNIQNYNDMESQARKALEIFAEDVRQASSITWNSSTTVSLIINAATVTYSYNSTAKTFVKDAGLSTQKVLITGVTRFEFRGYSITGNPITDFSSAAALTVANRSTKQLQISLEAARYLDFASQRRNIAASNTVLSARFILRNKIVTT
jgi:Tfp pilus assembly protein PilW